MIRRWRVKTFIRALGRDLRTRSTCTALPPCGSEPRCQRCTDALILFKHETGGTLYGWHQLEEWKREAWRREAAGD